MPSIERINDIHVKIKKALNMDTDTQHIEPTVSQLHLAVREAIRDNGCLRLGLADWELDYLVEVIIAAVNRGLQQ